MIRSNISIDGLPGETSGRAETKVEAKSGAERMRLYRERKKLHEMSNSKIKTKEDSCVLKSSTSPDYVNTSNQTNESPASSGSLLLSALKRPHGPDLSCRMRLRHKILQGFKKDNDNLIKPQPSIPVTKCKSGAERTRLYRERKKLREMSNTKIETKDNSCDSKPSTSADCVDTINQTYESPTNRCPLLLSALRRPREPDLSCQIRLRAKTLQEFIKDDDNLNKLQPNIPITKDLSLRCSEYCQAAKFQKPSIRCSKCLCYFHESCIAPAVKVIKKFQVNSFTCKICTYEQSASAKDDVKLSEDPQSDDALAKINTELFYPEAVLDIEIPKKEPSLKEPIHNSANKILSTMDPRTPPQIQAPVLNSILMLPSPVHPLCDTNIPKVLEVNSQKCVKEVTVHQANVLFPDGADSSSYSSTSSNYSICHVPSLNVISRPAHSLLAAPGKV